MSLADIMSFLAAPSLTDWIVALATFIGVVGGLIQYKRNSARAAAIKAFEEMEKFSNDDSVRVALRSFEWRSGFLPIKREDGTVHKIAITPHFFPLALRHHETKRSEVPNYDFNTDVFAQENQKAGIPFDQFYSVDEQLYREMFDKFLGRLEGINSLIKRKVITEEDFRDHFYYWLDVLSEDPLPNAPYKLPPEKRSAIWNYIRVYQNQGVIELFSRFNRTKQ